MVRLEYNTGKQWITCGQPFLTEALAWMTLGVDSLNYRTVDEDTGKVITDNSKGDAK